MAGEQEQEGQIRLEISLHKTSNVQATYLKIQNRVIAVEQVVRRR